VEKPGARSGAQHGLDAALDGEGLVAAGADLLAGVQRPFLRVRPSVMSG
jgi:hypothetical protein